jgi:hypothetical protein
MDGLRMSPPLSSLAMAFNERAKVGASTFTSKTSALTPLLICTYPLVKNMQVKNDGISQRLDGVMYGVGSPNLVPS